MLLAAALYVYVLDRGFGDPAPMAAPAQPVAPASTGGGTPEAAAVPSLHAAQLLHGDSADWLCGTLDSNARVFAISFERLAEQAHAMNRLAAYLEKAGAPRNRVLNDKQLAALIARSGDVPETFYLGHDYRISDIARFFNQARQQQLVLQPQEQRLLGILVAAGLLTQTASYAVGADADAKALITLSRLSPSDRALLKLAPQDELLGTAILAHEISHGEFLTRPAYRQQSWQFWTSVLSEKERQQWRLLLRRMDYDADNEDLLVNEMQALLMHTPDGRVFNAVHLLIPERELGRQRLRFTQVGKAASL